jgi:hypothetical protein
MGELVSDEDDAVGFILKWNLNEDAQSKLMSLSPSARRIVIDKFNPPEGMAEVNGKLIKFAAGIANAEKQTQPAQQEESELDVLEEDVIVEFIMKWNLNEDAQNKLRRLTPEAQRVVISTFDPPVANPEAPEVNGKFIMFAASVEKARMGQHMSAQQAYAYPSASSNGWTGARAPQGGYGAPAASAGSEVIDESQIIEFIERWNLNEDAQTKLRRLNPFVLGIVMSTFDPPVADPAMPEVNGKFIVFASSVEKAKRGQWHPTQQTHQVAPANGWGGNTQAWPAHSAPAYPQAQQGIDEQEYVDDSQLAEFAERWNLNEDAQNKLVRLHPFVQKIVITTFDPPVSDTEALPEVNGKFIMFASSVEKAKMGHIPAQQSHHVAPNSWTGVPAHASTELQGFIEYWALNEDAQKKMYSLGPELQQKVIASFSPPPDLMEVSGKLIMFAASLQRGLPGKGEVKGIAKGSVVPIVPTPPLAKSVGKGKGIVMKGRSQNDAVSEFIQYWCLGGDAQAKLWGLPPEMRQYCMDNFNPPPHMTDVTGKFIMYANSLENGKGGPWKGGSWTPVGGDAWHPAAGQKRAWSEADGSFPPAKRLAFAQGESWEMQEFVNRWGLNEDAVQKLTQLSPEALQNVMQSFAPNGTAHPGKGWSGKLITFAARVQQGTGAGANQGLR